MSPRTASRLVLLDVIESCIENERASLAVSYRQDRLADSPTSRSVSMQSAIVEHPRSCIIFRACVLSQFAVKSGPTNGTTQGRASISHSWIL